MACAGSLIALANRWRCAAPRERAHAEAINPPRKTMNTQNQLTTTDGPAGSLALDHRSALAVRICDDLTKKLRQIANMDEQSRARVLAGLVDGLAGATQPYPNGELLPPIRPAFDRPYEAGYDVAETWARIAHDWPNQ